MLQKAEQRGKRRRFAAAIMAASGNNALKKLALVEVTREYQVLVTDDEEKRLLTDAQYANLYLQQLKQGQIDANKISVVPLSLADVNTQIIGQEGLAQEAGQELTSVWDADRHSEETVADENGIKAIVTTELPGTPTPRASNEDRFEWTHPATRLLLQLYRTYNEKRQPEQRKKDMWNSVSQEMKANGYKVDGETCDKKWRNLKTRFRAIVDKHKVEGVNRMKKKWEYFDAVHEILQRENELASQPLEMPLVTQQISPSLLCSALLSQRTQKATSNGAKAEEEPTSVTVTVSKQAESNPVRPGKKLKLSSQLALKKLRTNALPKWLEKYIEVQRSTEEKRIQQLETMHQETVQLLKENNQALEKMNTLMAEILQRPNNAAS